MAMSPGEKRARFGSATATAPKKKLSAGQLRKKTRDAYEKAFKKSQKEPGKKLGPARETGKLTPSGGGGSGSKGSGVSAGAYDSGFPVQNIDEAFMNQVASAEATTDLIEKIKKFDKLKKVKDIYKNADSMFDAIASNPTLTQFQKNQLREQISFVKQNHARLGYSLNDLLAAVGTGAYNQIVSRTPIGKEQAEALGLTEDVQNIMDTYGRQAVLRPDGTVGAISPTFGELIQDAVRGGANILGAANPFIRFLTGGKGINVKAPEFGFADLPPNLSGYFAEVPAYAGAVDLSKGIGAFMQPTGSVAGAAKVLQNPAFTGNRQGGGRGSDPVTDPAATDATTTTPASVFAYQPYTLPVAFNYTGGPEQMFIGGGFTQDGKTIGPFRAANGGIANFKGYGY
jgi:hypothetical protein